MNIGVIPARLDSKRFPKKILALLHGKPMIAHVVDRVKEANSIDRVILAIDSEETQEALAEFDFEMVMTSRQHQSGTDRVAEVIQKIDEAEIIINIQGDEPLIDPNLIDALVTTFEDQKVHMSTVVSRRLTVSNLLNPNIVKALLDDQSNCIEFKRNIFDLEIGGVYRHIGIYGFRRNALYQFTMMEPSQREIERSLEQLRALDNGLPIRAVISNCDQWAVDTEGDLEKVSKIMKNLQKPIQLEY